MKDIAIVICNFNKKEYLRQCLDSLFLSNLDRKDYEVIVVDNASQDGAPEMIKNEYANDVTLLENEINSGGAGGFARGINYAAAQNYRYLALLDNDIRLETDTLSELQKYLEKHEDVAIAGSKICTMDQPDILQELGSFIDMETFNAQTPLKGHKDSEDLPDVVECDYVPACCLLARMDIVKKIGAFDVNHFIYWDDMDWCTKVRELGYKIHALNSSRVFHKMGAINTANTFSLYYFERNRILFFLKHLQKDQISLFTDQLSQELINLTFFSNEKGKYNSAISQLLGIDDILINNLGRQDERILLKEQNDPFTGFETQRSRPIIFIPIKEMRFSRKIYNDLSSFFDATIKIAAKKENIQFFQQEFHNSEIFNIDHLPAASDTLIFCAVDHIMHAKKSTSLQSAIFIDCFLNIKPADKIENFLASYETYKDIFMNIFKPVLEEKFKTIHTRLSQK